MSGGSEPLTPKERMAIPRAKMPEQNPDARAMNFEEVPFGLTAEQAMTEAKRCLSCRKEPCIKGCPVGVNIPEFIGLVAEGKFVEDVKALKLDEHIHMTGPPHFEGGPITLRMTFKDDKAFAKRRKTLERIAKNPALKRLLEPFD